MKNIKNNIQKRKYTIIFATILTYTAGIASLVFWFNSLYQLQMPILIKFQSPVKRIEYRLIDPRAKNATSSAVVGQAYADQGPQIDPGSVNMFDQGEVKAYVKQEAYKRFGAAEWDSLDKLLSGEGNYQSYVFNHQGSGACGIFQFLPCEKLGAKGMDLQNQVSKGFDYIASRYGTPTKAYVFWLEQGPHWY